MDDIRDSLWNSAIDQSAYGDTASYQNAVFEQYKLCVEMADRVSARRNLSNTFFLALNSAIVTVLTAAFREAHSQVSVWLLLPGLVIIVSVCAAWFALVRSYRLLNGAKFTVIGALEERLPAYAYSRAEWRALGEGRDWHRYLPLTHIEQWIPVIFAVAYLVGFFSVVL
ncbi:hypothetical protein AB0O01_00375 [Streptomyces sp. NPDC093252]|uniref:RipA family octameric membrane protein n=1 Tax=Streptomyces sp. NPDC093252 TaxID=3154980 RepID=UPI0034230891